MADNLTTATIDVRANTRGMERDILKALQTIELSQINTKKSSQALGRITGQVSEFNKSLEASNARVIAFGASAGAIFAVEKALTSLISSTINVQKQLADVNVLLNLSSSSLEKFGSSLFDIARNTAQSFSEVATAATELSRQGLGVEETLKRTNAALILTRLSGLDAKSSVEALTATLNSFSGSALDAVEVVNKLANVDAAFAVSSADLANAISRVGSTAVDAGVSLDELIALVTSAQQTTARGGAVIGNSFKTIFTRLQRGKVQDLLGSLGVDTGEGQSAISLLQQLASTYDTLGASQKSYVAEQVGGVFQINILKAALSDLGKEYSIYGRALDTSLSSTDEAIRRNELLNKTVSALSSQTVASLEQAANKIGSIVFEPNAKGFLSGFNNLLESFNNIDAESAGGKLMTGFFKGIGDFIGGPGAVLATAVLVKLFARLGQFAAGSAKELLGTNKAAQQQAAIEQSILSILQKNSQFTSQILAGKMTTVQAEKQMLDYLTAQSNILREQERLSKVIGANLAMKGVSVGASGIPMTAPAKKTKAAASGYIPNFVTDMAVGQAMESAGAREHGYKAGKARKTTIHDGNGKSFKSFVNNKEDVKTFTNAAGKKATVVRPPNGFGENTQYAAGGYIPNFAKNKVESLSSVKSGGDLKKLYDFGIRGKKNSKTDYYSENVSVDRIKLPYSTSTYDARSEVLINRSLEQKKDLSSLKYKGVTIGNYLSGRFDQSKLATGNKIGNVSNVKGALGEIDTEVMLKKMGITPVKLSNKFGVDFSYKDKLSKQQLGESKVTKEPVKDDVIYAKALTYLGRKANPSYKGNSNSDTVDLSALGVGLNLFESKASGFVPNFASMGSKFKAMYGGGTTMRAVDKEKTAKKKNLDVKKLDLSDRYTMVHGGNQGLDSANVSLEAGNKLFDAKIATAGLDTAGTNLQRYGIKGVVGDALVGATNNIIKTFGGTEQITDASSLDNAGSVGSAAGTVFETALRKAFNAPAVSQTQRIDFPAPTPELKKFFHNAPGQYEAKISRTPDNLKSTLKKWVDVNGLASSASGFVPNFADFSNQKIVRGIKGGSGGSVYDAAEQATSGASTFSKMSSAAEEDIVMTLLGSNFAFGGPSSLAIAGKSTAETGSKLFSGFTRPDMQLNRVVQGKLSGKAINVPYGNLGKMARNIFSRTGNLPDYKRLLSKMSDQSSAIAMDLYDGDDKEIPALTNKLRPILQANINKSGKLKGLTTNAPDYDGDSRYFSPFSLGSKPEDFVKDYSIEQAFSGNDVYDISSIDPSNQYVSKFARSVGSLKVGTFKKWSDPEVQAKMKALKASGIPAQLTRSVGKPKKFPSGSSFASSGFIPNLAKTSGLSFSQSKKDEFGFSSINAILGGKKVGGFSYSEDKPGNVDVGDLTVEKAYRGKGYGSALYEEAIKRNKGKKMKGQLLPQMNRLLQKIKNGEPVSAETLYPQIKRADLAKSSMFEVYGHKGMEIEKMTRDQFSSFVNAKINELKKDPKKLQSYFGNVEADEYGGLGVDLQTQHASGFVPNFLDIKKDGSLPFGVRGRANFSKPGSKPNIQLGVGATPDTLFHEASHLAYSKATMSKANSNEGIGRFLSDPRKYAGVSSIMASSIFKNVNQNELFKSLGLNPVQLDFDGKNPGATYSGAKAVDEITTRIQEKIFKNKGNLASLSANENTFVKNLEGLGIISNKRMSNVSRRSAEGSKFRSLIEGRFSSAMGGSAGGSASGFIPNFADQVRKNMYDWDGTIIPKIRGGEDEYIRQLGSLKEKDLLPIGKKLKAGKKKFDVLTSRPPLFEKAIRETSSRLGLPVNKISFGVKPKDKLVEAQKRGSKIVDDNLDLMGKPGFLNARVLNKRLSSGFVPNFGGALSDAIGREQAAGLSKSQIYVDKHSSLKNPGNPMGLMVANRRDEPAGGFQGVARARKEGVSPKSYGSSRGFVPNFASPANQGGKITVPQIVKGLGLALVKVLLDQYLGDGVLDSLESSGLKNLKLSDAKLFAEELRKPIKGKHRRAFEKSMMSDAGLQSKFPEYYKKLSANGSSSGFIPNFSNALNDAIARERSSGLSKSQIYVDKHSSLKNKNNPMGLMVANTRDEPKGGIQGIKRAKKQGLNPKTYGGGMSSGYVPNFAFLKPDQEDVDALKEFTDALKKLEDDFSNPEKKAERLEKRKSRLESIPYGGVSTAETQAAESKITKAKDLRERLIQKGDMGGAQRAQALVQSAQSELSKLEKDLEKKNKR